ncbi:MAG: HPr(Ser) kinase/phosphatase [Endomicrobium sp.]|jgi:HPr kinase/phosphorylase|nr:HPr(Ser) kinase/phosphatase [Endomicrobium sp.]
MSIDVNTLLKERSEDFKFELLTGSKGVDRVITVPDINRPGLALAGFFEHFPYERIQVLGVMEHIYLNRLDHDTQRRLLERIFSNEKAVGCILTRNLEPTTAMIKVFSDLDVPLLKTELRSSSFIGDLIYYLRDKLAPSIKVHGVMTSVYGLGVLIIGKSAIGKSECALELVKRGHKLVVDDIVNIKKRSWCTLIGSSLDLTKHLMEVRGIGVIDIKELFGTGNILDEAHIELVIELEEWDPTKQYERMGMDEHYTDYLNVKIPKVTIPVGPGRNLAVLVETASLNQRVKNNGYFAAKNLSDKLQKEINKN